MTQTYTAVVDLGPDVQVLQDFDALFETEHFWVSITDNFHQPGDYIIGYGIFNKQTQIQEMEVRRLDMAQSVVAALEDNIARLAANGPEAQALYDSPTYNERPA